MGHVWLVEGSTVRYMRLVGIDALVACCTLLCSQEFGGFSDCQGLRMFETQLVGFSLDHRDVVVGLVGKCRIWK